MKNPPWGYFCRKGTYVTITVLQRVPPADSFTVTLGLSSCVHTHRLGQSLWQSVLGCREPGPTYQNSPCFKSHGTLVPRMLMGCGITAHRGTQLIFGGTSGNPPGFILMAASYTRIRQPGSKAQWCKALSVFFLVGRHSIHYVPISEAFL